MVQAKEHIRRQGLLLWVGAISSQVDNAGRRVRKPPEFTTITRVVIIPFIKNLPWERDRIGDKCWSGDHRLLLYLLEAIGQLLTSRFILEEALICPST